jgi:hypothetical protein
MFAANLMQLHQYVRVCPSKMALLLAEQRQWQVGPLCLPVFKLHISKILEMYV